jgi:phosphatidylglycerophosphate synthase
MRVALRTSAFGCLAVALIGATAAAWWLRIQLQLSPRFPALVAIVFVAVMLLAIGALVAAVHPFDRFGPANQATTVRAALVAIVAGLLFERATPELAATAAVIAGLAAIIDGMDGWLARSSRMSSAFGARFDLEIDALLILALATLAWQHDKAGVWILLSGLLRYLFIAGGLLWYWLRQPLPPSLRRQTICVIQVVALIVAVLPVVRPPMSTTVAAVSLAVLAYSFLVDTLWLWRNAS